MFPSLLRCLLCLLAVPLDAGQRDKNNCHDPAAWADWNERVMKYPDDKEFHVLHAL
jgi:hypothetical protein